MPPVMPPGMGGPVMPPGMGGGLPGMGGPSPGMPPMGPGGGMPPGLPMPGRPPAPPGAPPAAPPGGGNPITALGQMGGPAAAGGNAQTSQLMSMLAGIGLQNMMQSLSKFMKTMTTVGTRQDKPVRVQPGQAGTSPSDGLAAQGMPPNMASQLPLALMGAQSAMGGGGAPGGMPGAGGQARPLGM